MISKWEPGDGRVDERLLTILREWEGTKHWKGQQIKGLYTDCLGFVCGVLDDLMGRPVAPPPAGAVDAGPESIRLLLDSYPLVEQAVCDSVVPGDVILIGPRGEAGRHAMIVGPERMSLWHCPGTSRSCVTRTGLQGIYSFGFEVFRRFSLKHEVLP